MIRQIIVPQSNTISIQIPDKLIGKSIELIAFEIPKELKKSNPDKKKAPVKAEMTKSEKEKVFEEMFGAFPDFPSIEEIRAIAWKKPEDLAW